MPYAVILLVTVLLLSGCTRQSTPTFLNDFYRTLDHVAISPSDTRILLPRSREMRINTEFESISFTQFFNLADCELNRLIGRKNSALAKAEGDTGQLYFDVSFIALLKQCLPKIDDDQSLVADLSEISLNKRDRLPITYWNALIASREINNFFREPTAILAPESLKEDHAYWDYLMDLKTRHQQAIASQAKPADFFEGDKIRFYRALGQATDQRLGGQLMATYRHTTTNFPLVYESARKLIEACQWPEKHQTVLYDIELWLMDLLKWGQEIQRLMSLIEYERLRELSVMKPEDKEAIAKFDAYWRANWSEETSSSQWNQFNTLVANYDILFRAQKRCP